MKLGGTSSQVWPLQVILNRGLAALHEDKVLRDQITALGGTTIGKVRIEPTKVECITIEFETPTPSKKNALKPTGRNGMSYRASVKKQMGDLQLFATSQWAGRRPLKHPTLHFHLTARSKQDRDGMVTTLMDVLKKAGVIVDDSIEHCNGLILIHCAMTAETVDQCRARVSVEFPYFEPPRNQVT